jgi:hypothetical protein
VALYNLDVLQQNNTLLNFQKKVDLKRGIGLLFSVTKPFTHLILSGQHYLSGKTTLVSETELTPTKCDFFTV